MICARHRLAAAVHWSGSVEGVRHLALLGALAAGLGCSTPTEPSAARLSGTWKVDVARMYGTPDRPVPCHLIFTVLLGANGETADSLSGRLPDRVDRSCPPGGPSARNVTWSESGKPLWLARSKDQLRLFYYPTESRTATPTLGYGRLRTADLIDLFYSALGDGTMDRQ
jgi:hypothetical protein